MISFTIPIKPFSVNATHYRDKRHKTVEFKNWELEVQRLLSKVDMSELSTSAKEYAVGLRFYYPESVYYTAQGRISARTMDLSNVEKPILDCIFLRWLSIDDRYITVMRSSKLVGKDYAIEVTISEIDAEADTEEAI